MKSSPFLHLHLFFLLGLLAGCTTPTPEAPWKDALTGKNVTDVTYAKCDVEALARDPSAWNWNFRPYGSSTDSLWSDPKVQRDISSGGSADGRVTGLNVTCDEQGFVVLVYCNEPRLADYFAKTNGYPGAGIEFFVQLDDADQRRVQDYNWFFYDRNETLRNGQWIMESRHFRQLAHQAKLSESIVDGKAVVAKFELPWTAFWDKLPFFSDRTDNFWRLGCARWGGAGGVTYGGEVHQGMRAGYIRWPAFTDVQKTAIMKETLRRGWDSFMHESNLARNSLGRVFMDGEYLDTFDRGKRKDDAKYRLELNAKDLRSYVNYPEDPHFRPTYERLVDERRALAGEIAKFDSLSQPEREALYRRAADKLFNFRYDVEAAYQKHQKERIMK